MANEVPKDRRLHQRDHDARHVRHTGAFCEIARHGELAIADADLVRG
ncbi:hypothetical protein [Roseitranquillus sediminis]|nr:hypothetical protein [Roseitranquillus sediminis]MBM9596360.1 hypothetical protein [Roseitranquillus sediminis]